LAHQLVLVLLLSSRKRHTSFTRDWSTDVCSSYLGMGLATTAIGLIPSDQAIGVAAPLLLLFCRLLQGFFVGGEMGGAATMVVERSEERCLVTCYYVLTFLTC